MQRLKDVLIAVLLIALMWVWNANAGDPAGPGTAPDSTSSYTVESIYQRLNAGTTGTESAFTEPSVAPGTGTMHTLNEVMEKAPAKDDTNGVVKAEVPSSKTFWGLNAGSNEWGLQTGTAAEGADVTGSDGELAVDIPGGFYSGVKTATAQDSDLTAANIKSGVNIFGINGTASAGSSAATGDAEAANVLSGKTFSNASSTGLTGTMTETGAVIYTPNTVTQTVAAGYHNGSGTVKGDTDLVAANVKSGADIFGVAGNVIQSTGTVTESYVLAGSSFSNATSASLTGTMTNTGAVIYTPNTVTQTVAAGYHNGEGKVAGDTDLVAGNIKSGIDIFGIAGGVIESTGTVTASYVLAGSSFSNGTSASLTGTMTDTGAVIYTPSTVTQTVAAGYHNGEGKVTGDADLDAANIKKDVDLFGVTGTYEGGSTYAAAVPKTGAGDISGYTEVSGEDGHADMQKGVALPSPRFTDNGDGTVTDELTGLIWLTNANCASSTRNWATALSDVESLNADGTMNSNNCGDTSNSGSHQTDWRLPNVRELHSLIHYGYSSPALSNAAGTGKWAEGEPFTSVQSSFYWSSSTYADSTADGWYVSLSGGGVSLDVKTFDFYVWPVRGGQ